MSELRKKLWGKLTGIIPNYYRTFYKMEIGENVKIAKMVKLDTSVNPKGIHIGDNTWILRGATILAHDHCRSANNSRGLFDTYIGNNCVIGINSIILPGVIIGDHCVIAAGTVVTKNTPPHTVVAGNPSKVIRTGVSINDRGQIIEKGERVHDIG